MSDDAKDTGMELPPEAMRAMGYAVVDRLVERWATLGEQRTWRGATRAEMRDRLDGSGAPEIGLHDGSDASAALQGMLDELAEGVFPYRGNVDHPRFFAFVPSCPTWPAVLGDFMAAGLNVFQGTWLESAGPSALELEVLGWFKEWIGYPAASAGLLLSGGSAANLTALVTARSARLRDDWRRGVIYASDQAHSSVFRAARILGFDREQVRQIPCDDGLRLPPSAVAAAVAEDRARGLEPFLVVANGGATSTGVADPLDPLAELCADQGLWLHVDAAYGGFAVLTDTGARALAGIGRADSVTLDPHKWLYQPFEAGCLMVRDGAALVDAFHILPDYLQDTELDRPPAPDDAEVNFADRGPQLTRSFRALKIWLSVRYGGLARIRAAIQRGIDLGERAETRIRASDTLELLTPATLGILCFRSGDGEAADTERVQRLSDSGLGMISSTRVRGEYALRLCILSHRTRWEDVEAVLANLEAPI